MLQFKRDGSGTWMYGQRRTVVEDGSCWAVNPLMFKYGYICFDNANKPTERLASVAQNMADAIAHRGPDDIGLWVEAEAGIAFGHRRLSIIDLSSAGHQPMASSCGRYVVTYNGEI